MTRYQRIPGVEAAPMQDETVLFAPASKKFCVLNPTAAHVWDQLEQPRTELELATSLLQAFDGVDEAVVTRDVQNTLREFATLGIVAAVEGSNGSVR